MMMIEGAENISSSFSSGNISITAVALVVVVVVLVVVYLLEAGKQAGRQAGVSLFAPPRCGRVGGGGGAGGVCIIG